MTNVDTVQPSQGPVFCSNLNFLFVQTQLQNILFWVWADLHTLEPSTWLWKSLSNLPIFNKFKIRNQMDLKKYRMVFTWMKCPRYFTLGLVLHYHAIQLPWKNSWHFVILSEVKQYHVHVSRPASHHASRHVTLYVALDVRLHVRLHGSPHFTLNVTLHVSSLVFLGPLLLARVRENALLQILIHTLFLGFLFQLQWSYHKVCDSYDCFTTKVQRISKWRWQTTAC